MRRTRRLIERISKDANRPRVHRGRLAEDYDGIGQYVMVMLSEGSSSVAYRAKLAIGDFGTGEKIPAGVIVTVTSYRGQLEVISLGAKGTTYVSSEPGG